MSFVEMIIILVALGVGLWLINTYIPMQANIKKILNGVIVFVAIMFVFNAFGIIGSVTRLRLVR